ncbi:MAG: type IV pilus biogenesis protein PilP [Alphaproteobacteria bacterium]|nr:type IV pilus biogenesis protein PilP [Alphaproteobacteria bacterium]
MRNYALITVALSALLLGLSFAGQAVAQDALADTLPAPASSTTPPAAAPTPAPASSALPSASTTTSATAPVFTPTTGATTTSTTTTTTTGTTPTSSAIVPVPSSSTTLPITGAAAAAAGGGLNMSPQTPSAVTDAMARLQKVDQINLDDMVRAQDAINRLDLLLEIEKRQTELKKVRDERNKPSVASATAAAAGLLGSAIPAAALNLPKIPVADTPAVTPSFTPKASSSSSSSSSSTSSKSSSGPSEKLSIRRISGTDGRYFAVINLEDNSTQTVHAGDKLPDGSLVKSITLTSVSLIKDKKSKNLTIPTDSYIVRESTGASLQ